MTRIRVDALGQERAGLVRRVTLGLLLFTGVSAVLSALAAFTGVLDMDAVDLGSAPFASWRAPMAILGIVVGGGSLIAAHATWLRRPYAPALAFGAGALLFGFVLCEVWWLGVDSWLQPFELAVAAGTMLFARGWAKLSS